MKNKNYSYVLITPARNEENYIENTIKSVTSQTILPKKWIIVSDGSTDRTDEIAKHYESRIDWIELIRMPEHDDRHFAAKVHAFNAGYNRIRKLTYEVIGSLDADLSFESDYMEYLLTKFTKFPELGVAGTPFIEDKSDGYDYNFTNIEHVSGACQLFRRECFEEIGGYRPIKGGGIDWVAVTTARMKGWKTKTFTEKKIMHYRQIGTGKNNVLMARLKLGEKDYCLGNHPVWEVARSAYQMATDKPPVLAGLFMLFGYIFALAKRSERPISEELIEFCRAEQIQRLKKVAVRITGNKGLSD